MAVLQVAINPLLRVAGGEEHFAFNSAFAQLIFGAASFLSPLVYSDLVGHSGPAHPDAKGLYAVLARMTTPALPWVSIYWIFAVIAGACVVLITLLRFPMWSVRRRSRRARCPCTASFCAIRTSGCIFSRSLPTSAASRARPTGCRRSWSATTMSIPTTEVRKRWPTTGD